MKVDIDDPIGGSEARLRAGAEAIHDSLVMLGVNPDEIGEGDTRTTAEVLAGMVLKAAADDIYRGLVKLIADHPMWIGDDGQPLTYLPEREARISDFCAAVDALVRSHG